MKKLDKTLKNRENFDFRSKKINPSKSNVVIYECKKNTYNPHAKHVKCPKHYYE